MFLKEVSYVHQGCIHVMKNTIKNIFNIYETLFSPKLNTVIGFLLQII